ncbi:hypothetical protein [Nocardiopsis ganjiahuensis]|uniref:hypothetical protein n=1 Tax=Nocardiopsis ganjiahuensis TaxID=239984 RepID=UPI00034691C8|nr:hypothetical protein [Nocardiopsis ganjiahuensis]
MPTLRTSYSWHRPLMLTAYLCVALLAVSAVGLAVDDRTVNGEAAWLKPAKFSVSIVIYNVTIAWLLSLLTRRPRAGWWLGTVIAVMGAGEMALIITQVARGQMSHFNNTTPFDAVVYAVMGGMITVLWVATLVLGVILVFQRIRERSTTWAIRIGVGIALLGMAVGPLMTAPTPAQVEEFAEGGPDAIGAHAVGLADGGPGLPLVGWSTVGGDLRVGHFVGIHGLQVIILFALALTVLAARFPRLRDDGVRLRLTAVVGAAYTGLTVLTVWQALRGQSVVAPDVLTLAVGGTLAALTALGLVWVVRVSSGQPDEEDEGAVEARSA